DQKNSRFGYRCLLPRKRSLIQRKESIKASNFGDRNIQYLQQDLPVTVYDALKFLWHGNDTVTDDDQDQMLDYQETSRTQREESIKESISQKGLLI
ncbi:10506_t:CDS:2, partial [Funneliformis mosseae]